MIPMIRVIRAIREIRGIRVIREIREIRVIHRIRDPTLLQLGEELVYTALFPKRDWIVKEIGTWLFDAV
ncbi:MAG: hypothetical protein Kow001_03820 [Acidobacteriota bacterium]